MLLTDKFENDILQSQKQRSKKIIKTEVGYEIFALVALRAESYDPQKSGP